MIKENELIVNKDEYAKAIAGLKNFNELKSLFAEIGVDLVRDAKIRPISDIFDDVSFEWQGMTE